MTLKVYGDLLSQPVRAVVIFCLENNISHELVLVDIVKKEHKLPEFKAINPRCQVPVIDDDGFILPESTAILSYLAVSRRVPDHWYPAEFKARARVDYLLAWYHTNIRQTSDYFVQKELLPVIWKAKPNIAEIESAERTMIASMDLVEEFFLNFHEGHFLLGAQHPSIADILFACEYTETKLLPEAEQEKILSGRPRTKKWLEIVEKILNPHFAEAHKTMPDLIEMMETARKA
ncbi:hypothetical protein R1flu_018061 [Riccia fluitans]|uniref:Glutathione S-transferase n=1 Tax=Riccia fluitans TaxID=41844 RepID=A0ABD1ZES1_9MARC